MFTCFENDDTQIPMETLQSLSPGRMKVRPLCPCCGWGEWRKGYIHCIQIEKSKKASL